MSAKPPPGSGRGDITVSAGRQTLGYLRGEAPNVFAYTANGDPIGTYADRKAASRAISDRAAGKAGVA